MNMLIAELNRMSDDPKSWIVVLLLAGFAIHSIASLLLCPYVHGKKEFTPQEVAEARAHRFEPGVRFAVMMVFGIVLTLTGLFMIPYGIRPTIALLLLVVGMLLLQTEPARLQLREQKVAVIASAGGPEEKELSARDRLRGSHRTLAAVQATMVFGVAGVLLAF